MYIEHLGHCINMNLPHIYDFSIILNFSINPVFLIFRWKLLAATAKCATQNIQINTVVLVSWLNSRISLSIIKHKLAISVYRATGCVTAGNAVKNRGRNKSG